MHHRIMDDIRRGAEKAGRKLEGSPKELIYFGSNYL